MPLRLSTRCIIATAALSLLLLVLVIVAVFATPIHRPTRRSSNNREASPTKLSVEVETLTVDSCSATRTVNNSFTVQITATISEDDGTSTGVDFIIYRRVNGNPTWHWRGRSTTVVWTDDNATGNLGAKVANVTYRVRIQRRSSAVWNPGPPIVCTSTMGTQTSESKHKSILPEDRRVDWAASIGYDDGKIRNHQLPVRANTVVHYGVEATPTSDSITSNHRVTLQAAIDQVHASGGGVVYIPKGTYRISGSHLILRESVVLRGSGVGQTELFFDGPLFQGILVGSTINSDKGWQTMSTVQDMGTKGSSTIAVPDATAFTVGSYAEIEMNNYPEEPPPNNGWSQPPGPNETWRLNAPGQILKVTRTTASTISFTPPLHLTYESMQHPQIRPITLFENAGIEALSIRMSNDNLGRAVKMQYTANVWMHNVETRNALASHVELLSAYRCHLAGNYMVGVSGNGDGGQGYGINIGRHTTGCHIENNILSGFRHSVLFQVGATGNVFAYNYSTKSVHPESDRADLSFHGNFATANLVEGNVVQQIYVADWWGRVGPWNTMLRNCIAPRREGDTGNLQISYGSDQQNILGNYFLDTTSRILIDKGVLGTIVAGNSVDGWTGEQKSIAASLYLHQKPAFFGDDTPWPVAEWPSGSVCENEASRRSVGVACAVPAGCF